MATKIIKQQSNSEERNAAIEKAESEEIELLFVGLRALQPVLPQELGDTKPLRCHMFTVEKFLADGRFDKVKTRMVANGDEQDPQFYPDRWRYIQYLLASPWQHIHGNIPSQR